VRGVPVRGPGSGFGDGRRRWRALDLGTTFAYVAAPAPRVCCRKPGVVAAAVPWARHGAAFTRGCENQVGWLAVHASKPAVAELQRIAWRTVERIADTQIRLITRPARREPSPPSVSLNTLGGLCPSLPGRSFDPRMCHKTPIRGG